MSTFGSAPAGSASDSARLRLLLAERDREIADLRRQNALLRSTRVSEARRRELLEKGHRARQRLVKWRQDAPATPSASSSGAAGVQIEKHGKDFGLEDHDRAREAFVERVFENTRLVNRALDRRRTVHNNLAILTGRVKLLLERALADQAELIISTPQKAARHHAYTAQPHSDSVALRAQCRAYQDETEHLVRALTRRARIAELERENEVLGGIVRRRGRALDRVKEESRLHASTMRASLDHMARDTEARLKRAAEERGVLMSTLRQSLNRMAMENAALGLGSGGRGRRPFRLGDAGARAEVFRAWRDAKTAVRVLGGGGAAKKAISALSLSLLTYGVLVCVHKVEIT